MTDSIGVTGEPRTAFARRGLLGLGARLALAGPALLAGLHVASTTVHADDDGTGNANADDGSRPRPDNNQPRVDNQSVRRGSTFNSDLVPTNAVNQSDFSPNISDSGSGALSVVASGSNTSSVVVSLRGATANQTYTLAFVPLSNSGSRQSLGAFTTNAGGNGRLSVDGALAESGNALGTRVGVFVLRRGDINGPDAFVTAA